MLTVPLRRTIKPVAAMLAAALCLGAGALGFGHIQPATDSLEGGVFQLQERLASLTPARPMDYFRLAEELAYLSAVSPNQRSTATRLAEQLYVLAYELERAGGGDSSLGPSVCLALADLAPPEERDWLLAIAASFGQAGSSEIELERGAGRTEDRARLDAAEAIGRFRAVERRPLSVIMRRIDVRRQMVDAGVPQRDADWVMGLLERGLQRPYCPECRNQRLVRTGTPDQSVEQSLCPQCFGNPEPDPPLSGDDLRRLLGIEARLLNAKPRTWTAEVLVGGGEPLNDLDPSGLADRYGVDARRPYWVSRGDSALAGAWHGLPGGD